jgi:hypothetical protein
MANCERGLITRWNNADNTWYWNMLLDAFATLNAILADCIMTFFVKFVFDQNSHAPPNNVLPPIPVLAIDDSTPNLAVENYYKLGAMTFKLNINLVCAKFRNMLPPANKAKSFSINNSFRLLCKFRA